MTNIKDIVKNNTAEFDFYRAGNAYYTVKVLGVIYTFPIPVEDLGQATVTRSMKAITLMRYIRKAIEGETFIATGTYEVINQKEEDVLQNNNTVTQ